MLASLSSEHSLRSVAELNAFRPQYHLLCRFCLFQKNLLSLPTTATLLLVVMPLSVGTQRIVALLVLSRCGFGACHTSSRKFGGP